MSHLFRDRTWPQIKEDIAAGAVLLLPFGQTEQHGTHLQTGCDTIIAEQVCDAVAERIAKEIPTLVLPAIPYGYVPKAVTQWPGTFRVGWDTVIRYTADVLCSAADMGFKNIVIVSTHGPHGDVGRLVCRDVFDRTGVCAVFTQPHSMIGAAFKKIRRSAIGGTSHACEYETSLLLHFGYPVDLNGLDDRDSLKMCNEWVAGDLLNGSGKVSWSTWAVQQSETGTYGDPSCASAETGRAAFESIIEEYCRFLRFFRAQNVNLTHRS